MKSFKAFQDKKLIFHGIKMWATTNKKNEVEKHAIHQKCWNKLKKAEYEPIYLTNSKRYVEPNGIGIITEVSNVDTIDIDKPDKCHILDKLLKDCKFYVKTRKGYHFYFQKTDLPRKKLRDGVDINTEQLFYVPTYTNNNTGEEYHYELVKDKEIIKMPEYVYDWCKQKILDGEDKETKKTNKRKNNKANKKIIIDPHIQIERFDIETMQIIYKVLFNAGRFGKKDDKDSWELWTQTAWNCRHLNNTEESYKLFHKYSKKAEGYEDVTKNITRKCFYGNDEYNENYDEIGILFLCRRFNPVAFKKISHILDKSKYIDEATFINTKYIYQKDNKHIFKNWMEKHKVLMIKSAYGTGKTYCFKELIKKYDYQRILFITYRQSLAHSLSQELKEKYGFVNYLDEQDNNKLPKHKRLILQLNSLHKIFKYDAFEGHDIPQYDLLVLDEIEGILNQFDHAKIDQGAINSQMEDLIKATPKILCLDGDLADRSYDFISDITDDYEIIINKYVPKQKTFIFHRNEKEFEALIKNDLENGLKVVVVSMGKGIITEKYKKLYEKKYKVIIHTAFDSNSKILLDVNNEWKKADLLLYSPKVEAGVDFTAEHFDKCYGIMMPKSTTYRAFSQMLNRVRNFKCDTVNIFTGLLLTNQPLWRFDEMKYQRYKDKELTRLETVMLHNYVEKSNSDTILLSAFIKLMDSKGHKWKFADTHFSKKQKLFTFKELSKAQNLTLAEWKEYLSLQEKNHELSEAINIALEKYNYKRIWKLDKVKNVNDEFLERHYHKNHIVDNFKKMIEEERPLLFEDDILQKRTYERIDYIKSVMNKINDIKDLKEFNQLVSDNFGIKKAQALFQLDRKINIKNHLHCINEIFNNYGYEVIKKAKRVKKNKQLSYKYSFTCDKLDIIKEYEERCNKK